MSYDLIKKINIGDFATVSLHMRGTESWEVRTRINNSTTGRFVFGDEKKAESELHKEHKKVLANMKRMLDKKEW